MLGRIKKEKLTINHIHRVGLARHNTVFVKRNPPLIHNFGGDRPRQEGPKIYLLVRLKPPYKKLTMSTVKPPLLGGSRKPNSE